MKYDRSQIMRNAWRTYKYVCTRFYPLFPGPAIETPENEPFLYGRGGAYMMFGKNIQQPA